MRGTRRKAASQGWSSSCEEKAKKNSTTVSCEKSGSQVGHFDTRRGVVGAHSCGNRVFANFVVITLEPKMRLEEDRRGECAAGVAKGK